MVELAAALVFSAWLRGHRQDCMAVYQVKSVYMRPKGIYLYYEDTCYWR